MRTETDNMLADFFSGILEKAIVVILKNEDPQMFLGWFAQEVAGHFAENGDLFSKPQDSRAMASSFGRALWNAVPLPGNGFRPRPLPAPRRNDPCPCGSLKKFKRCCGHGPAAPGLDSDVMWPLVLDQLPAAVLAEAIASGKVPINVLLGVAYETQQSGKSKTALRYLEPVFNSDIRRTDEDHDYAMNLLCDLYDDLGFRKKKSALLERVTKETKRSPLRSGALQRLAAMSMDEGNATLAWETFQAALRDDPDSPNLGLLEVQLLMGEHKTALASERARYWVGRLKRIGWTTDEGPLAFLSAVARDPEQAMAKVGIDMAGGAGQRLQGWLASVAGRKVADYRLADEPPGMALDDDDDDDADTDAGLAQRLEQMGIPAAEIPAALANLSIPQALADEDIDAGEDVPLESQFLVPPESVLAIEDEWHVVFPAGKPFSVGMPGPASEVWEPHIEDAWMDFLDAHPRAFDSLDILDDLATSVLEHEQWDIPGIDEALLEPVLRRAQSIIEQALVDAARDTRIVWAFAENRPALRCLVQLVYLLQRYGNDAAALDLAGFVLSLNPNDNHGLRTLVVNALLRSHDDAAAVALAAQYPNDLNPDISFGMALALYRLGRREDASTALTAAITGLPNVPRFLTAKRIRKPRIDQRGVLIRGGDQAWLYRQEMRDVWDASAGALSWLRSSAKQQSVPGTA